MKKNVILHHLGPKPARQLNRLAIFLVCLALTVVVTAFSIWYNLNKVSAEKNGLIDFLRQRFEEGFQNIDALNSR